tara:strand:- start:456 stop:1184 length:729 start_codon:yes stop_codon:yes gene_type:complete
LSDGPYEFQGSISEIVENLSLYGGAVKAYSGVVAAFLIIFSYNSIDLMSNHWEVIQDATTEETWSLSFVEEIEILEEGMVLQDEEKQTFTFYLDDIDVPEGFLIGELNITVDDTGNDGIIANSDPTNECDSVLADVREGGLTAQWDDSNNTLSGQANDCEPFYMYLRVYPNYDGTPGNTDSVNEYQALLPWQETGWGEGELEIDVEVNTDESLFPGQGDDDEEITITVQVVMFEATAVEISA